MTEISSRPRARRQLLLMFGIAFAALGIAYGLFYYAKTSGGWGTTNNGSFVTPPMKAQELASIEGFETEGKWWLWMVTSDCRSDCQATLEKLKSLHILLNRDADRVERALMSGASTAVPAADEHLHQHGRPTELRDGVYIVDPLGNLVLRYPVETEPKPVLEDLKRLLKLSQIG